MRAHRIILIVAECFVVGAMTCATSAQEAIIVDHRCTDVSAIPQTWLDAARENLRVGYCHTSHGSQLVTGIEAMQDEIDFSSSSWESVPGIFLNDQWAGPDLGSNGDLTWEQATRAALARSGDDRNVVMWSWCGGVSDNTYGGIQTYLEAMDRLERDYPAVRFVYMTGHLDGSGAGGNLHQRNEQIRTWCQAHDKFLFDFADIESFDPDGDTDFMALYATDGCEYDSNNDGNPWGDSNWAQEWIADNSSSELSQTAGLCDDCAHSERLNCILKGRAFWWMMARLAGWNGASNQPSCTETYLVPAVAHAPGAGGSAWRTDLTAAAPLGQRVELELSFTDYYGTGRPVVIWSLEAGEIVRWSDVLVSLFQEAQMASTRGVIEVCASARLALTARTYNQAGEEGTYGQGLPALTEADAIPTGKMGYLPGVSENDRFRSNLGIANISDNNAASVRIRLWNVDGDELGAEEIAVPARSWIQIERVLTELGAEQADLTLATIEPLSSTAKVWAYVSVIDNGTGDPTTVPVVVP